MIICLTGLHASGKGAICNHARSLNIEVINKRETYRQLYLETPEGFADFESWYREYYTTSRIAKLMIMVFRYHNVFTDRTYVFDSVHNQEEWDFISSSFTSTLVLIRANPKLRYARRKETPPDIIKELDNKRLQNIQNTEGISLYEKAQFEILNEGSLIELHNSFNHLMKTLGLIKHHEMG